MREIDVAVVGEAIVHIVGRRATGDVDVQLSDTSLRDADGDAGVIEYIAEHIKNGLTDSSAVAADFEDPNAVAAAAFNAALDPKRFVAESKVVARQLGDLVQKDKRLSDGTFVVARYQPVTQGVTGVKCLAVIKLDASAHFTPSVRRTDAGQRITLQPVESILPSAGERLQKAAFLRPRKGAEHQLLVVDRQTGRDWVARWFMADYLGATPTATDQTRTDGFYRAVRFIDQALDLDDEQRRQFEAAGDQALRDGRIDTRSWVANRVELDAAQKQVALGILDQEVPDVEFAVHRETATRLLKTARFQGDDGLVVTVPSEHADRVVGVPEQDRNTGEWYVRLRTTTMRRTR